MFLLFSISVILVNLLEARPTAPPQNYRGEYKYFFLSLKSPCHVSWHTCRRVYRRLGINLPPERSFITQSHVFHGFFLYKRVFIGEHETDLPNLLIYTFSAGVPRFKTFEKSTNEVYLGDKVGWRRGEDWWSDLGPIELLRLGNP